MIDPLVRRAVASDGDQLRLLEREARAGVADQRGGRRWLTEHPEIGERWEDELAEPDRLDVVGHIGEVVVGYLAASLVDDLAGGLLVQVDQVWVTPQARELGFGDELLAAAIAAGRANGAIGVEGQALPGDRHTKNLYERAGIVARLITTYRAFD